MHPLERKSEYSKHNEPWTLWLKSICCVLSTIYVLGNENSYWPNIFIHINLCFSMSIKRLLKT